MRQKKIKEATTENIASLGVYTHPQVLSFQNNQKIILEIGAGKGQFITNYAQDFKNLVFIAVERNINICYRIAQKKQALKLDNLSIILDDASNLNQYLGHVKVDQIYINFPDPWPKKRHHKRRLTYPLMLKSYQAMLKSDGLLYIRTDHEDFFNDSLEYIASAGFQVVEINRQLPISNYMTEYEEVKRLKGPIYQMIVSVKK